MFLVFAGTSFSRAAETNEDGQAIANKVASFATKAIYNLDNDQLVAVLESFLDEKPEIQALTITETIEQELLLTYFRQGDKAFYDQPIPEDLLKLPRFSAPSMVDGDLVGTIVIYYDSALRRDVQATPKTWAEANLLETEQYWLGLYDNFSLGIDPYWAPFEFLDENGAYSGISSGYVDLVASRLGIKLSPRSGLTWTEVLEGARNNEIDIIPTIARTPEREKYLNFTDPYISFPMVITTRKDAAFVDSLAGLSGKRVGVVKGYVSQEMLETYHKDIKIVPTGNLAEGLEKLHEGKIDAFVDNLLAITHEIDHSNRNDLKIASPTKYKFELSMAVRKGLPDIVPILNKALASIDERERAAIVNSWTAIKVSYGIDTKTIFLWAVPLISGAIIIIVVVIFWARYIQKQNLIVQRSENRLSSIIETAPDGIIVIDEKGIVQTFSPAAEAIFGYGADEILGKNVSILMPKEMAALHDGYLARYADTGESHIIGTGREVEALRKNGEVFPLDLTVGEAQVGDNVIFTASVRDITERKKAEEALRSNQQLLESVIGNSPVLVFAKDIGGRYTLVNKKWEELTRIPREDAIGKSDYDIFSFEVAEALRKNDQEIIASLGPRDLEEITNSHMGERIFLTSKVPLFDSDGNPEGICGISTDITERKQSEKQLQDAFEVISGSIDYASRIQRSVLPDGSLFSTLLTDHFVLWEPRDVVGGDIYWSRMWGDGFLIILGDCTGHGVPGAFMTLIVTGALDNALTDIPCGQVASLMQRIHQLVQVTLGQHGEGAESDDGMELGVCYLGPDMDKLTFVGARFELHLVEDGYVSTIKGTKKGIGYRGIPFVQEYEEHEIVNLAPKSFYMTSDGLVDQVGGERNRMFGKKRFRDLLLDVQDKTMKDQKESIHQALIEYQGEQLRRDDVSVVGFRLT